MKKIALRMILCLLLCLAACASTPTEQPTAPVETQTPVGSAVYVYSNDTGSAAVDQWGNVILEASPNSLRILRDGKTGEPWAVARTADGGRTKELFSPDGAPLTQGPFSAEISVERWGSLYWYGNNVAPSFLGWVDDGIPLNETLCRSDGTVLLENLTGIAPVGEYLFVQPSYQRGACMILDGEGAVVRALDKGFRFVTVCTSPTEDYAVVSAPDGTQTLVDSEGAMCLDRFYEKVSGVSLDCALVQEGRTYLAVDLGTGSVLFESQKPISQVTSLGAVVHDGLWERYVDWQGKPLSDEFFESLRVISDEAGRQVLLRGLLLEEDGSQWAVYLDLDGTERFRVEYFEEDPMGISERFEVCASFPGAGRESTDAQLTILDLETGTQHWLHKGYRRYVRRVGPELFICQRGDKLFDVLDVEGQVRLTGLSNIWDQYDGVIRCDQGEASGLLRTDGTWLYRAP